MQQYTMTAILFCNGGRSLTSAGGSAVAEYYASFVILSGGRNKLASVSSEAAIHCGSYIKLWGRGMAVAESYVVVHYGSSTILWRGKETKSFQLDPV